MQETCSMTCFTGHICFHGRYLYFQILHFWTTLYHAVVIILIVSWLGFELCQMLFELASVDYGWKVLHIGQAWFDYRVLKLSCTSHPRPDLGGKVMQTPMQVISHLPQVHVRLQDTNVVMTHEPSTNCNRPTIGNRESDNKDFKQLARLREVNCRKRYYCHG